MLLFLLLSWLVLAVPFTVLVGKGIALASRFDDGAADLHRLEVPSQAQRHEPAADAPAHVRV